MAVCAIGEVGGRSADFSQVCVCVRACVRGVACGIRAVEFFLVQSRQKKRNKVSSSFPVLSRHSLQFMRVCWNRAAPKIPADVEIFGVDPRGAPDVLAGHF